jgi:HKD family nuclease
MNLFYWHGKTESGNKLKDELLNMVKVSNVKIASAYFSKEGLAILKEVKDKYLLNKNSISIYLSPEFSYDKPHELLLDLSNICKVHIVYDITFHPKVYLLKGTSMSKLIFGSSNFTNGGFNGNIEFDSISEIGKEDEVKINSFFDYCNSHSKLVDAEIIKHYEECSSEIEKLKGVNKKLKKVIYSFENRDDAFDEDDYDLDNMYFNFQDYETLFQRNQHLNDSNIRERRISTRNKLMNIQKNVNNKCNKINLYSHYSPIHTTSLIDPSPFNHHMVSWIGVRYGKNKKEIDFINHGAEKDSGIGFQKHACLQFSINPKYFEINLFHAVSSDAFDRMYLQENMHKLKDKIIFELKKLKGQGLQWVIYEYATNNEEIFDIDCRNSAEFIDFYRKHDHEGRESFLAYRLEPNDVRLKDKDSISELIIEKFNIFLPLYNILALRPQKI